MKRKNILTALLMIFSGCLGLSAQTETLFERGTTYLESTFPPSPDPASVVKYADVPFTHSCGMAEYEVPIYTLQGRELSIPIGLRYASGGIKLDEIAGVAGLGWTLQAGGCITRTIMDMPDEFSDTGFSHEIPSGELLSDLESMNHTTEVRQYLRKVIEHRIDSSLDLYHYSVNGLNGSFVILDDGTIFELSGGGTLIRYYRGTDNDIDRFTLTGPDGTTYLFATREKATFKGTDLGNGSITDGSPGKWNATTAWYLTQMRSCSGMETATFIYDSSAEWKRTIDTEVRTLTVPTLSPALNPSHSLTTSQSHTIYETKALARIILGGYTASFTYAQNTGNCIRTSTSGKYSNYPHRLTRISVNASGNPSDLLRMEVGTARASCDGRIILNDLRLYRGDVLEDKWDFTYKMLASSVSHGSQDWYGYYNAENEIQSANGTHGTCPYVFNPSSHNPELTNGYPNSIHADYMSLKEVDHDGTRISFTYEGNHIDYNTYSLDIGVRVKMISVHDGQMSVRSRRFKYDRPHISGFKYPSLQMYMSSTLSVADNETTESPYHWHFALHSSARVSGYSLHDTRVFYGRVIEDSPLGSYLQMGVHFADTTKNTVRTVYEYRTDVVQADEYAPINRFPNSLIPYFGHRDESYNPNYASPYCRPRDGVTDYYIGYGNAGVPLLSRKEVYACKDSVYILVSSSDYTYSDSETEGIVVGYNARLLFNINGSGNYQPDYTYHYPVYSSRTTPRNPIKEIHVGYHTHGNDTTVVNTSYLERISWSDPIRVASNSTITSDAYRLVKYTYSDTWEGEEDWPSSLADQHYLSIPLKREYKKRQLHYAGSIVGGPIGGGTNIGTHLDPRAISSSLGFKDTLVFELPYTLLHEEMIEYGWVETGGSEHLLPIARIEKTGGGESWREDYLSRNQDGAVTSVKERGRPETVILWGYKNLLPVAVVENASISEVQDVITDRPGALDSLMVIDNLPSSLLDLLNGLRDALPAAHVTTYTYLPGIGVTSVTDPAGIKTVFEYDHAGRLTCVRDNDGNKVEEYDYSLMADSDNRRHMRSRMFLNADGTAFSEDVRWWDVYGRRLQDISLAASGAGEDLVTAYSSDFMMHDDAKTWLPYPVQNTAGAFRPSAENEAVGYHGNALAYSLKNYEISSRDRVISTALPGFAGEHETAFETDVPDSTNAIYWWQTDKVRRSGYYPSDELVVEKTIDADGRVMSTCKDHFGKTVYTSVGNNKTHYVYDLHDRLRAVKGSGIAATDTLNMWRYDYDSLGRMSSKGIPGSVREYYTYDDEDRVIAILRDGVLKEMEYDAMNRVTKVWQTRPGRERTLLENHTYDVYPSGVTGSNPKGKKTQSRIAVVGPNSDVTGYTRIRWSYDDKGRPAVVRTMHTGGNEHIEELEYTFAGEVSSSTSTYLHGNKVDVLSVDYTYDQRGRLKIETATLTPSGSTPQTAKVIHEYDDLGRPYKRATRMLNGSDLETVSTYALQGWINTMSISLNDNPLFIQSLGYDSPDVLSGTVPQYSGLISKKNDKWINGGRLVYNRTEGYTYDDAGRLAKGGSQGSFREYTYDSRGNILSELLPGSAGLYNYGYDTDRLTSLITSTNGQQDTVTFAHDALGRMTFDGTTGQSIFYNDLDLVGNISQDDMALVNYSYLSDGTKLSALDGSGAGLVYRGPFVYRTSDGGCSLTLESAAFGGGRLTPDGAMFYVTDYLGSVRAVIDGKTGALYKAANYSAFGDESQVIVPPQGITPAHPLATAALPDGMTLRDSYTGKEVQTPDFSTGYTDFGARQYSPTLRRWMPPDPLSEKYYGISPYAFCNNNPVNFVDPDGERQWPVNPKYNGYNRRHENNFRTSSRPTHNGLDINLGAGSNDLGAPVYATHDGIVTRYVSINDDSNPGGNRIQITSENGDVSTYYMHLDTMSDLKEGDFVSEGDQLGTIGGSGAGIMKKYPPHLHYELKIEGDYVNPAIDSQTLIDPQQLITPIHMGTIDSSIIIEQGKSMGINVPTPLLTPVQIKLEYEKY